MIQGFSSSAIRVLDVTNPDRVWEVAGVVEPQDAGFAVTLSTGRHEKLCNFA